MRALTVWEPYASLLVCGLKRFETRGWETKYRGPLVIHAAKRWDRDRGEDFLRVSDLIEEHSESLSATPGQKKLGIRPVSETLGCCLGVVWLSDCQQMDDGGSEFENEVGYFGSGRFGWKCDDATPFEKPVPVTGKQGLWTPPDHVVDQIPRHTPEFIRGEG